MSYRPGEIVALSGIYKCDSCGNEITCVEGEPFPPCANDCRHPTYTLVRATR
jgi:hypothetical protein